MFNIKCHNAMTRSNGVLLAMALALQIERPRTLHVLSGRSRRWRYGLFRQPSTESSSTLSSSSSAGCLRNPAGGRAGASPCAVSMRKPVPSTKSATTTGKRHRRWPHPRRPFRHRADSRRAERPQERRTAPKRHHPRGRGSRRSGAIARPWGHPRRNGRPRVHCPPKEWAGNPRCPQPTMVRGGGSERVPANHSRFGTEPPPP